MPTTRPVPLGPTLAEVVRAFQHALGYTDDELTAWLDMPIEGLAALDGQPWPDPFSADYLRECQAVARAVGCDAWSLSLILLWASGRR